MKLFKIEGQGYYGGGVILVFANTPKEAAEIGNNLKSHWDVKYKASNAEELNDPIFVYTCQQYANQQSPVILHYEMGE